jgi:precorrin-6B methylase 1
MSGEFAWVLIRSGAYAHNALDLLADAMEADSEYPATKTFIEFMDRLKDVMSDIAYVEAGDSTYTGLDVYRVELAIQALQVYRQEIEDTVEKLQSLRK